MVIRSRMRRAWTHKFQSSGPTVYSLYCDAVKDLEMGKCRIRLTARYFPQTFNIPNYIIQCIPTVNILRKYYTFL